MAAKKKAAKRSGSKMTGYELCVAELSKNKNVDYASVKAKADQRGISLYPIVYGRAKASLGLVPVAARGKGKAKKTASKRGPGRPKGSKNKRGPGRPPKAAAVSGLEGIVVQINELQRERDRLEVVLGKVRDLVDAAL